MNKWIITPTPIAVYETSKFNAMFVLCIDQNRTKKAHKPQFNLYLQRYIRTHQINHGVQRKITRVQCLSDCVIVCGFLLCTCRCLMFAICSLFSVPFLLFRKGNTLIILKFYSSFFLRWHLLDGYKFIHAHCAQSSTHLSTVHELVYSNK